MANDTLFPFAGIAFLISNSIIAYKKIKNYVWLMIIVSLVLGGVISVTLSLILGYSPGTSGVMSWFWAGIVSFFLPKVFIKIRSKKVNKEK